MLPIKQFYLFKIAQKEGLIIVIMAIVSFGTLYMEPFFYDTAIRP